MEGGTLLRKSVKNKCMQNRNLSIVTWRQRLMLINHEKEIQIAKEPEDDDDYDKDKMQKKQYKKHSFKDIIPSKKESFFLKRALCCYLILLCAITS